MPAECNFNFNHPVQLPYHLVRSEEGSVIKQEDIVCVTKPTILQCIRKNNIDFKILSLFVSKFQFLLNYYLDWRFRFEKKFPSKSYPVVLEICAFKCTFMKSRVAILPLFILCSTTTILYCYLIFWTTFMYIFIIWTRSYKHCECISCF